MLISIITVSYNSVSTIEQTIQSVLNQSYKNIEYIIIDGGSTDGTIDIIKKYESKLNYWISEPDKGIYDAMNKGIKLANGEYIGLINSDDWYTPTAIENIVNEIQFIGKENVDILCGNQIYYYNDKNNYIAKSDYTQLKDNMSIYHPTCFVKNDIYKKRLYSLKYKIAGDYDYFLWCYVNNYKFHYLDRIIANFRAGGISSIPSIKYLDSFYIWREHVGLFHAIKLFSKDFILKACKYPIKKIIYCTLGSESYWSIVSNIRCKIKN